MVITRNHGVGQVPGVVEMNPTDLPDLFKPLRDLNTSQKTQKAGNKIYKQILKNIFFKYVFFFFSFF